MAESDSGRVEPTEAKPVEPTPAVDTAVTREKRSRTGIILASSGAVLTAAGVAFIGPRVPGVFRDVAAYREEVGVIAGGLGALGVWSDRVTGSLKRKAWYGLAVGAVMFSPDIAGFGGGADGDTSSTATEAEQAAPGIVDVDDHTITITLPNTIAEIPGWLCQDIEHKVDGDDKNVIGITWEEQHLSGDQLIDAAPAIGEEVADLINPGRTVVDFECVPPLPGQ